MNLKEAGKTREAGKGPRLGKHKSGLTGRHDAKRKARYCDWVKLERPLNAML